MSTKSKDLLLNKFSQSEFELNEEKIPYSISVEKLVGETTSYLKAGNKDYDSSILYRSLRLLGAGVLYTFETLKGKLNKLVEEKVERIESKLSNVEIHFEERRSLHASILKNEEKNNHKNSKIRELIDGFTQNISMLKGEKAASFSIEIRDENEVICSRFFQKESEVISLIFLCMKKNKLEKNIVFIDFKINETEQLYKTQASFELNQESMRWSKIFMENISSDFIPILKNDFKDIKFELISDLHQDKEFFNICFSHDKTIFASTQKMHTSRFSRENGLGV